MKTKRSWCGSPLVVSTLLHCSAMALAVMPVVPDAAKAVPTSCQTPMALVALSGTWQAEALAQVPGGVGRSLQQLRLQVGPDGRVSGERRWLVLGREDVNTPKGRNHLGEPAFRDQGPLIGMINPVSCRVLLVETKDSARLSGWVQWAKGRPRLELEASQSGPGAVVFFASFQRRLTPLHNP